jgi:tetratricopeptide (TPR) repeat protein
LQYTEKELEEAEVYLKPARNPFFKKSFEALQNKDYATAEENALQAIESEPTEPSHYYYLGCIYHEMQKPNLEIKQYLKAKSMLGPTIKMPGLFLSIGEFYCGSGDFDSAIDTYREYLSKHGIYFLINESLAKAYEKKGEFESALNQYILLSRSGDTHFENIGVEGIRRLTEHNESINSD